ncbi:MAG: hypothetical protein JWQ98_2752 [Chlorobi bacterium]|nr:hypothetical protein [Chlorobiota bacterium]
MNVPAVSGLPFHSDQHDMSLHGSARACLAAFSLLVAFGCGDSRHAPAGGHSDSGATSSSTLNDSASPAPTTTPAPLPGGDSLMAASKIDTSAPTPLAPAPRAIASDTIPLKAPDGGPTRYGIATGRVVLRFTGNRRGERRLTFDHYGVRERKEENVIPYPLGSANGAINNVVSIVTDSLNSYADVRTRMGWQRPNLGFKRYLAAPEAPTTSLGAYLLNQSGAERLPDTVIAGYHCKVLRKSSGGMTVTNWVWRGITIREHLVSTEDKVEYIAEPVEISANIDVPASTFEFPKGYRISDYTGK